MRFPCKGAEHPGVRRIVLLLIALAAGCYGGVARDVELAAAQRHACSDRDTWIETWPPVGNDDGPWAVIVCGRRYYYSRRADGHLVETSGGEVSWRYADGVGAGYGAPAGGPVHVRGYHRRDGTYVRPHTRSRPR